MTLTRSNMIRLSTCLAVFSCGTVPLAAQAQVSLNDQMLSCTAVNNDIARLQCFDALAAGLQQTVKTQTTEPTAAAPIIPKTTQSVVTAVPTSTPPKAVERTISDFGKNVKTPPKPKEAALLTSDGDVVFAVKHVQVFDYVKKRFYMANGQVWEQITATDVDIEEGKPPAGTTAEISKTGFGGYKLKLNNKKWGVKVKRVR